ncbi:histidine phosphotransferase ChpT [Xanthobacter tagetidis]|uniref:Histidine phosphotransferase n=1 Tax=Xanthobacter tagetidis TaxID=60216 RepID=A0A3L7A556_9HYPH|nr:histidine phosphotransferase family protein [Xanthobacter tagetidis]MBB6307697.1 histidine phosphotransferase ChpT [Xanthobacter tagetidis]RLP74442.1 histidine phosphotransferase [Xanthobacter tagetidis]
MSTKAAGPAPEVSALDLAALLCSRVCHDVISPVGAVVNGVEVLEDKDAADMREVALDLIAKSARQASARLQFTRLAFGAAGSVGARLDLGDAEQVVRGMIEDERTRVDWQLPRELLPKNRVKLLLNLVLLATTTIPRGGAIVVNPVGAGDAMGFRLVSTGVSARIPQGIEALIGGATPEGGLDAHVVQPYYAGMLARECAMAVGFVQDGDTVTLTAA